MWAIVGPLRGHCGAIAEPLWGLCSHCVEIVEAFRTVRAVEMALALSEAECRGAVESRRTQRATS